MATVHVVGAGLAGLACAVRLAGRGRRVAVWEAARQAGGRCRSFFEPALGRTIDNGNHLLLGANAATMAYLDAVGGRGGLVTGPAVAFPFVDVRSGARWTVRPNGGPLPWWLLAPSRRVPESRLGDYLAALRLARARDADTVADVLDAGAPFFERFWRPLVVAVLNTEAEAGAARLMWPVVAATFGRGGGACRPWVARDGLTPDLVDPALAWLRRRGVEPAFGHRLRRLDFDGGRAAALEIGDRTVALEEGDAVVLAVPPARAAELVPGLAVPTESRAIVNAHYRLAEPAALPAGAPLLGIVGGAAHWLFVRGDVASVTVSAADAMLETPAEAIAARLWADVARALDRADAPLPPFRIVKERRATFAQTPEQVALRPPPQTRFANLYLAGDWTATGLPATIESAVLSGHRAAELAAAG